MGRVVFPLSTWELHMDSATAISVLICGFIKGLVVC